MGERYQLRLSGVWWPTHTDRPLPHLPVPQLRAGDRGDRSRRTTGGRMTYVRRFSRPSRLTFITAPRVHWTRQARLHTQRPREDAGRSIPPQRLDTYVFSGSGLKSFSVAAAAGVSYGAFVALRRRARSEVIQRMQPDISDESTEHHERAAARPFRGHGLVASRCSGGVSP